MILAPAVERIAAARTALLDPRPLLVAISGIDASGKGFVAERLACALGERGIAARVVHADDWLAPEHRRFDPRATPEQFLAGAIRFDALFRDLTTRPEDDSKVTLLEGIFLLKPELRGRYDLSIWVECGFETALERAVLRAQEGLGPAETIHAFNTLYFPAQEMHLLADDPRGSATLTIVNDPRAR